MAGLDPAIHAFLEKTRIWRSVMKKTGWYNARRRSKIALTRIARFQSKQ
jgi:hypothetical protein